MAKAFPKSRFFGFDYHDKSIEAARNTAKRDGVADRTTFEVAKAKEYPGKWVRSPLPKILMILLPLRWSTYRIRPQNREFWSQDGPN
jgi:pyridoxine/pyridoxamine 5'-phosphate oxidase